MIAQIAPTHCTLYTRRGLNKVRGTWQTMQQTQTQMQTFITDQPRRKLGRPRRMADSAKCCELHDDDDKSQSIFLQQTQEN